MLNAARLAAVPVRSAPPARVALGAVGLALLFGLGYRISLRRLRRSGRVTAAHGTGLGPAAVSR